MTLPPPNRGLLRLRVETVGVSTMQTVRHIMDQLVAGDASEAEVAEALRAIPYAPPAPRPRTYPEIELYEIPPPSEMTLLHSNMANGRIDREQFRRLADALKKKTGRLSQCDKWNRVTRA